MNRRHERPVSRIWILALLTIICCGGCGRKYEPISLDKAPQAAEQGRAAESEEKEEDKIPGEEDVKESTVSREERDKETEGSIAETTEAVENGETETSQTDEELSGEETSQSFPSEDMFYQQSGMTREEAEHGRTSFIEDVMNDSKEAVAARITYPRTVTVASGSYEVQDAAGFLAYYDEIFTDEFKAELDRQAEEELFCDNGMISFGEGLVWFFPSDVGSSMEISSINNMNGCTVRYEGESGVTGG